MPETQITSQDPDNPSLHTEVAGGPAHQATEGRVTSAEVVATQQEKEAANSALMDEIEASFATQGTWAIKVGERQYGTEIIQEQQKRLGGLLGTKPVEFEREVAGKDERALILVARERGETPSMSGGSNTSPYEEVTIVTVDGIKRYPATRNNQVFPVLDILDHLEQGRRSTEGAGFIKQPDGTYILSMGYIPDARKGDKGIESISVDLRGTYRGFPSDLRNFEGTTEDLNTWVKKSIDKVESPHKAAAERNRAQTEMARSAASVIKTLPPRT